MKGKLVSKLLENRKMVRTACGLMAAVVLMSGGLYVYDTQNTYVPELVEFIDQGNAVISDEEVPLASAPKVTKKTETKKYKKNVKLTTASTKTYSKRLPNKTTTKTTTKNSSTQTVKTVVKTQTAQLEKYKKGKKVKQVITQEKIVTTTTTTEKAVAATTTPKVLGTVSATSSATVKKELNVNSALPKADAKLRNAYTSLGFTLKVDSTVSYSGKFDPTSRTITMRKENDDAIYHEFGHFLAFIGGINTKAGGNGAKAFEAEKGKYTGANKTYVLQSADEYVAESYRDYCTNKSALQASRPQTFALIETALKNVTDAQVAKFKLIYKSIWK